MEQSSQKVDPEPSSIARLIRHPVATAESRESVALLAGAAIFVLATGISLLVFRGGPVPIAGPDSLGQWVSICAAVVAALIFIFGRVVTRFRGEDLPLRQGPGAELRGIRWFDDAALAVAHALIALLAWTAISYVLAQAFIGAVVYQFAAGLLSGVALALTAYAVFLSSIHLSAIRISLVLALFLILGIMTAMLSASDPEWWKLHLSSLGVTDDLSARAFNLTLIVAGVLVTTIAHLAALAIPADGARTERGRRRIGIYLALIGILLACVGIFPTDDFEILHTLVATGMAVVFCILVITLKALLPGAPHVFLILGYAYVGVIVLLAVFFATGYYTLTAVELIAGVLVFSWIIVFLRNVDTVAAPAHKAEQVTS